MEDVQTRKQITEPATPRLQLAGGPDRDARGIPYSYGTRRERRKINKTLNKLADNARKKKRSQERGEG